MVNEGEFNGSSFIWMWEINFINYILKYHQCLIKTGRTQYATTGLAKIPDNLRQTQMCASGKTPKGQTIDACQGEKNFQLIRNNF